ncbi:MAG TPA: Hsp70 family protein [Chthoniobacterales bacterium]|jgi:molecular chaperone DnaK
MDMILGIDLGTTNSAVGVMEAGLPLLLADADGERLTPSVVYFPGDSGPLVGRAASRMRAVRPEATVYSIKRLIGAKAGKALPQFSFATASAANGEIQAVVHGEALSPEVISALILGKLKRDAEVALEQSVKRAVITVPAYFNDAQRAATKRAGELAGLTIERILNEPTAAALAYGLDKLKDRSKIAVYDLGGGTFDVSILELNQGVFEVLATNGNTQLGGDDLDQALLADCTLDIPDWEKRSLVIEAKHRLSSEDRVEIPIPFSKGGPQTYSLTRGRLEQIARPIIERTRANCVRSLSDAGLKAGELDEVILVGGSTRMPLVRKLVSEWFGKEPNLSQNPDEAVALGATIQAGILSGAVTNITLLDVTPLSLGIETAGGLMNVLIPRNSTIPLKRGEMFTTSVNDQTSMVIKVLQGEREMARDNWKLGEFTIDFAPAPRGVARVGVQFEIDADGILHVLARDVATGTDRTLEVTSSVDVADEKVEQMIAESVEHAFDDMSERIFTEASLKAKEMLAAVENALTVLGDEISAEERQQIQGLASDVRQAVDQGESQQLKRANVALDRGTQNLATLLMERAMAAALEKRGLV